VTNSLLRLNYFSLLQSFRLVEYLPRAHEYPTCPVQEMEFVIARGPKAHVNQMGGPISGYMELYVVYAIAVYLQDGNSVGRTRT
jgi:hypothetical protein